MRTQRIHDQHAELLQTLERAMQPVDAVDDDEGKDRLDREADPVV